MGVSPLVPASSWQSCPSCDLSEPGMTALAQLSQKFDVKALIFGNVALCVPCLVFLKSFPLGTAA